MRPITEEKNLKDKKVLVRVDWSVPMEDGALRNTYQIDQSLSTIRHLRDAGAKVVILSHAENDTDTLLPVYRYVNGLIPMTFKEPSDLVLMDNLRKDPREKDNDPEFAKELAKLGEIFVNEAFPVSHREHTSIVGLPKLLPSFVGIEFAREIENLSKAFYPKRPFLFILGGAKFETKMPLLEKFVDIADEIFVGGALANDFFRAQGKNVGKSVISGKNFDLTKIFNSGKILLPEDTIEMNDMILDMGPRSLEALKAKINGANLIIWNGPLGHYERGYKVSTLETAQAMANSGKESIVGGGDTLAAVAELKLFDKFTFVSTGGGAMLDFLSSGTLVGIEALK